MKKVSAETGPCGNFSNSKCSVASLRCSEVRFIESIFSPSVLRSNYSPICNCLWRVLTIWFEILFILLTCRSIRLLELGSKWIPLGYCFWNNILGSKEWSDWLVGKTCRFQYPVLIILVLHVCVTVRIFPCVLLLNPRIAFQCLLKSDR